jgi:hypothetical protein
MYLLYILLSRVATKCLHYLYRVQKCHQVLSAYFVDFVKESSINPNLALYVLVLTYILRVHRSQLSTSFLRLDFKSEKIIGGGNDC